MRAGALLLPATAGLALGATFTPWAGPLLPFLAFAPLAAGVSRAVRDPTAPPLAPFAAGFVTATLAHGVGLYWMLPALWWRTAMAAPVYLLVLALIGIVAGTACLAAAFLHGRARWPLPLALAVCWTGFEWAAARAPGVPYAWLSAGASLAWHPSLATGAEIFGARFLTFWTVMVGAAAAGVVAGWGGRGRGVAGGVKAERRTRRVRQVAVAGLLVGLPAGAGMLRQRALEADAQEAALASSTAPLRVGVVQPGRGAGELERWLAPLRELRAVRPLDLAVFPERHLPSLLRDPVSGQPTAAGIELRDFARDLGAPVVAGAMDAELVSGGSGRQEESASVRRDTVWYNAAFVQNPDGTRPPPYRKVRLVPGLEHAGWAGPAFGDLNRGYAAGDDPRPLRAGPADPAVGVLICYDSAFESTARTLLRRGADWLLVLSNDDWLDPDRPFRTTWAYWQHATHARLRAVENRTAVVQVASTGHTFAVSATGEGGPLALAPGEAGVAVVAVRPGRGATVYARIGDVLGLSCVAVFALTAAWAGPWLSFRAFLSRAASRSPRSSLD